MVEDRSKLRLEKDAARHQHRKMLKSMESRHNDLCVGNRPRASCFKVFGAETEVFKNIFDLQTTIGSFCQQDDHIQDRLMKEIWEWNLERPAEYLIHLERFKASVNRTVLETGPIDNGKTSSTLMVVENSADEEMADEATSSTNRAKTNIIEDLNLEQLIDFNRRITHPADRAQH